MQQRFATYIKQIAAAGATGRDGSAPTVNLMQTLRHQLRYTDEEIEAVQSRLMKLRLVGCSDADAAELAANLLARGLP